MNGIQTENRPVVFFDGGCPMCRREIAFYQRLDREHRVEWRDLEDPESLSGVALDRVSAMKRFHILDEHGQLRSGADAFAEVWTYLPYWRWLARLVRGLYLVPLLEWAYRIWAERRFKKRCKDGACY